LFIKLKLLNILVDISNNSSREYSVFKRLKQPFSYTNFKPKRLKGSKSSIISSLFVKVLGLGKLFQLPDPRLLLCLFSLILFKEVVEKCSEFDRE
jgi:hypothetical protein